MTDVETLEFKAEQDSDSIYHILPQEPTLEQAHYLQCNLTLLLEARN